MPVRRFLIVHRRYDISRFRLSREIIDLCEDIIDRCVISGVGQTGEWRLMQWNVDAFTVQELENLQSKVPDSRNLRLQYAVHIIQRFPISDLPRFPNLPNPARIRAAGIMLHPKSQVLNGNDRCTSCLNKNEDFIYNFPCVIIQGQTHRKCAYCTAANRKCSLKRPLCIAG